MCFVSFYPSPDNAEIIGGKAGKLEIRLQNTVGKNRIFSFPKIEETRGKNGGIGTKTTATLRTVLRIVLVVRVCHASDDYD